MKMTMCSVLLSSVKEELFPVADATAFFTDLHHVLKVIAAGNMRTLCHRRLVLLEQVSVSVIVELISIIKLTSCVFLLCFRNLISI